MRLIVMVPVFNDWDAVARLVTLLDASLQRVGREADVLIVDDGSTHLPSPELNATTMRAIRRMDILHLRHNLGHQRAITIGLAWVHAQSACDALVVMDGDGQDRPEDVDLLVTALEQARGERVIFAERTRRSETFSFTLMYHLYRLMHRVLTGEPVRVGNFCAIPGPLLPRLVAMSDLWNHVAASMFKSKMPYGMVPTRRGHRYVGPSKMNFVALVTHGLSAMSVFGERIGVRLLAATVVFAVTLLLLAAVAATWILWRGIPVPAWIAYAAGPAILLMFQAFAAALAFVFVVLAGRDSGRFIPLRDYLWYVLKVAPIPLTSAG